MSQKQLDKSAAEDERNRKANGFVWSDEHGCYGKMFDGVFKVQGPDHQWHRPERLPQN